MEIEANNKMPFLDILVTKFNIRVSTEFSHIRQYINVDSNHLDHVKKGAIKMHSYAVGTLVRMVMLISM